MPTRIPDEARARGGNPIQPAWIALQNWADANSPLPRGRNIRTREQPGEGTYFTAVRQRSRPLSFFNVGIGSGNTAFVSKGWINGRMPTIHDAFLGESFYLDGRDLEGVNTRRPPGLSCVAPGDGGPGPGNLSYVCARLLVDPATGIPLEEALGPEFLSIVHRRELPPGFVSGGMPELVLDGIGPNGSAVSAGIWPLAILTWNDDRRIIQFDQFTLHNLQHRYTPPEDAEGEGVARHWFFGVT